MSTDRYHNLDGLRALAVASVLLYHYTTRFPLDYTGLAYVPFRFSLGWLGVDVFFVLSGYCIFMTLARSRDAVEFLSKRLARLQPAYTAAIALTFAAITIAGLPGREVSLLAAVANIVWLNALPGSLSVPHVDSAYWSLVVELKFYLWLAILHSIFGSRHLSLTWGAFCVIGFISAKYVPSIAEHVLIAPYAPMFLCGLVAFAWNNQPRWLSLGLITVVLVIMAFTPRYNGVLLIASILAVATTAATRLKNIRLPPPLVWLGVASYPLYLIHQNIGLVVIRESEGAAPSLRIALAIAVSLALAGLLHRAVDTRYQKRLASAFDYALSALFNRRRTTRLA